MQFRKVRFTGEVDATTRSVPVTISTDEPIDRGEFVEILDHSPGGVDLSRAPLPLIESHDSTRLNIGIVESLRVEGGRLRGVARFGESKRAREVFADVQARVVQGVSIGYELLDQGRQVNHPSGRAYKFKFKPFEVSAVSVPADTTAGFYRSKGNAMNHDSYDTPVAERDETMSRSQRRSMARDDRESVETERDRSSGILALATRHGLRDLADRHIAQGTPLELFRGLALEELHRRGSNQPLYQPANEVGLSSREVRSFSVARLYRSMIDRDASVAPFERECVREVQTRMERAGQPRQRGGLMLPYEVMTAPIPGLAMRDGQLVVGDRVVLQRDLKTSVTLDGGAMVGTDLLAGSFIEMLRARTLLRAMGATVLSGLVGNVAIPRQLGGITAGWVAQSGAATESDATFGTVTLTPKTTHGMQDVTRDLLLQGTPAVEGIIRADLLACMAQQIDYAGINGTGTGNQPTGVMNQAGVSAVVGGTNGAAPTWDHVVQLEEAVANSNTDRGMLGYLTNPKTRSKLKRTQKFSGTNGQEVFERPFSGDQAGSFGVVNGYRCGVTTNVRNDLTKGSASGVCSAILYGAWDDLLIGEWATAEILPDELTQAANRIIRMHVWQTVDIAVRRAPSFAAMLDVLTT